MRIEKIIDVIKEPLIEIQKNKFFGEFDKIEVSELILQEAFLDIKKINFPYNETLISKSENYLVLLFSENKPFLISCIRAKNNKLTYQGFYQPIFLSNLCNSINFIGQQNEFHDGGLNLSTLTLYFTNIHTKKIILLHWLKNNKRLFLKLSYSKENEIEDIFEEKILTWDMLIQEITSIESSFGINNQN